MNISARIYLFFLFCFVSGFSTSKIKSIRVMLFPQTIGCLVNMEVDLNNPFFVAQREPKPNRPTCSAKQAFIKRWDGGKKEGRKREEGRGGGNLSTSLSPSLFYYGTTVHSMYEYCVSKREEIFRESEGFTSIFPFRFFPKRLKSSFFTFSGQQIRNVGVTTRCE